jgi:hypothetical protein
LAASTTRLGEFDPNIALGDLQSFHIFKFRYEFDHRERRMALFSGTEGGNAYESVNAGLVFERPVRIFTFYFERNRPVAAMVGRMVMKYPRTPPLPFDELPVHIEEDSGKILGVIAARIRASILVKRSCMCDSSSTGRIIAENAAHANRALT